MLFADICNFTQLTERLEVDKLVKTLNDLFGKFDLAAEVSRCFVTLDLFCRWNGSKSFF